MQIIKYNFLIFSVFVESIFKYIFNDAAENILQILRLYTKFHWNRKIFVDERTDIETTLGRLSRPKNDWVDNLPDEMLATCGCWLRCCPL